MSPIEPIFFIRDCSNYQVHVQVPEGPLQPVFEVERPPWHEQVIDNVTSAGVNVIDSPDMAVKVTVWVPAFSGNTFKIYTPAAPEPQVIAVFDVLPWELDKPKPEAQAPVCVDVIVRFEEEPEEGTVHVAVSGAAPVLVQLNWSAAVFPFPASFVKAPPATSMVHAPSLAGVNVAV